MNGRYKITTEMSVQLVGSISAASYPIGLELHFDVNRGCAATYLQPGEAATVSVREAVVIDRIGQRFDAPDWLWGLIESDDVLEAEMLSEAWEADEAAREDRAEAIREDRLLERGQ